jgi:hypothetical protein
MTKQYLILVFTLTLIMGLPAKAQNQFTNGLVAYYKFDGNLRDSSAYFNDGFMVSGTPQFLPDRDGLPSNSLNLGGSSYVIAPKAESLNFNANFTLSLWVNVLTNSLDAQTLISSGPDDDHMNIRCIRDNPGGSDYLQILWGGAGSNVDIMLRKSIRGGWAHLVVVRSGTNCFLYQNGSRITIGFVKPTPSSSLVYIGGGMYNTSGMIDDVRMYNRDMSILEIQSLYLLESHGKLGIALIKAVQPSFYNIRIGTNYQLQVSGDFINWTNQGLPFVATNINMVFPQYFDIDDSTKLFFRALQSP